MRIANPLLVDLEDIVASMHERDLTGVPDTLKAVLDDVLVGYDNKLSASSALVVVVQLNDGEAEQAALTRLQQATAKANDDACRYSTNLD